MADFFEIDFLKVETAKSGDAIAIRYEIDGATRIHVVDGGFQATGPDLAAHIRRYYGNPNQIDHVVVTHPDGDHAGGLRTILEDFTVGTLWMLRPWECVDELVHRFPTYNSVDGLESRLRTLYPNLTALEEIALNRGIDIRSPFQGEIIGEFVVLAPSRGRYLDLIVSSERTPEGTEVQATEQLGQFVRAAARTVVRLVRAAWGAETFSPEETSAENEMSVVQYASLQGKRVLLTGDTGRAGLAEAADYAPMVGLMLPGIDRFQVPHHGSRRNVATELLDCWLGPRLPRQPPQGEVRFTAIISSAKEDEDHPRKSVVRAMMHRGAKVITTEGEDIRTGHNAPHRDGWGPVTPLSYPEDQEE